MHKRIWAVVLTAILLLGCVAFPTNAAAPEEETALIKTITKTYKAARKLNKNKSFQGYCGRLSSYTRYVLGIDKYANVHNGRDEYDAYEDLEKTTGGYAVKTYPATQYSLEEALNAVSEGGTRDVYNILVGFQKTDTDAGRKYGHAVMLYGILNGKVFFTESFNSALGGEEGDPIVASIKDFAKEYDDWAKFEGLIYFGTKSYVDFCEYSASDLFVTVTEKAPVYTIPSKVEVDGYTTETVCTIPTHERLLVTGLYTNTLGEYFYEISYDGVTGFVEAGKTKLLRVNMEGVFASGLVIPTQLKKGKAFTVSGTVRLERASLSNLTVSILNLDGSVRYNHITQKTGLLASISKTASNAMKFSKLPTGRYIYQVTCDVVNFYVEDGKLLPCVVTETLVKCTFTVGTVTDEPPVEDAPVLTPEPLNGWHYDVLNGLWKCYRDGAPVAGRLLEDNVDYYILEDGTAATGCVEINGEIRYFTPTGILRTGWYETAQGKMYLLSNGTPAKGWHEIDGVHCFFSEDGYWDAAAEYVPELAPPPLETSTEMLFGSVFESLSKFTSLYKQFMQ